MLKKPVVLAIGTLLGVCFQAVPTIAQEAAEKTLLFSSRDDGGVTTEFWVTDATLKATPQWRPADGDPPLSVAKAIEIASQAVKTQHPKFDDVEVWDVHIMSAHCQGGTPRWFYSIDFSPVIDGRRMFGGSIGAVVLMNGSLVEPKAKKE